MKKRIFSLILAVLLLLQAVPMQVYAASDTELPPAGEEGVLDEAISDGGTVTEGASAFAFNRNTGYPTDLNNQVYVAIYKGSGFPGEPAWYPQNNYTFFNGNFSAGGSAFASSANGILKPGILDQLTQGPTTDGVKVWGHYSSAGTKNYFVDGSPLTKRENEEKIIKAIMGSRVNVDDYEIIWYVIKFQTDTYWHIDGLIVQKETYNVNYYGNGNSSGNAPTGATGLAENSKYTVLGNTGNLKRVRNGHTYTFLGWNTKADGSGTHYNQGDTITITEDVSLYAQWQAPLIDVSVTKQWNDNNNQDAIRPDSVTVHLLQNDKHYGEPVTLNAGNNWSASWRVPAFDYRDNEIEYHVEEESVAGYNATVTGSAANGFTLVNAHTPETTSVQAQKIWNDDNDRDGIRPYGIEVELYKNGASTGQKAIMSKDNNWAAQWTGLEKNQAGKVGVANEYTVKEVRFVDKNGNTVANRGYSVSYGVDSEVGRLTVTNSYTPVTQTIQATKVWDDMNNQDGIRPASVTLTLFANGVNTGKTVTLDGTVDQNGEATPWVATFTNAYVNKDGVPIAYSIVENEVSGYTYTVTGNAQQGFTVTNTHAPTTTGISVNKVWDDKENQDGIRPTSITVELIADNVPTGKTLKLDASNNWSGSFTGLQKYQTGKEGTAISYTVKETNVPAGYSVSYSGTTITNTHVPAAIKLNVEKVWDDAGNNDGKRPDAVVVTLLENGRSTGETLTLNEENNWKGAWVNLPAKHNGQAISYSVVESGHYMGQTYVDKAPAGYVVDHQYEVLSNGEHLAKVVNSYKPEMTFVTVHKDWEDDDNRAGMRPDEITVNLYQSIDGGKNWTFVTSAKLDADTNWSHSFTNLSKFIGGKQIAYKVEEAPVAGYTTTYSSMSSAGVVTITNTKAAEKINVSAQKIWNDNHNRDGIRPESITVELYANGIATGETVVLNGAADAKVDGAYGYESEAWKVIFTDLYKHYNGKEISYTVREVAVPKGYEVSYPDKGTIVNTHAAETVSYPVTKTWIDANDQDGIRPDEVIVTLYADGVSTGKTLKLNSGNNWRGSFNDLPKYKEGAVKVLIKYSVQENEVSGYTAAYGEGTITNTHTPSKTTLSVRKEWADDNNHDGQRPDSVVVHLLANGVHMNDFVGGNEDYKRTLNAANQWTATWENLPEFAEGKPINYTVYEVEVGNGYSSSYSYNGNNVVITNTRQRQRTSFTVQKVWVDANNQDNLRYKGVMIQLYAGESVYGAPVEVNANNHWRYTWSELPVNMNGVPVAYTVAEVNYIGADGASVDLNEEHYKENAPEKDNHTNVTTITNTHITQKTNVSVRKAWDDNNNQDGKRPASVSVTLYNNGTPTNKTATLSEENGWNYTFENLEVHHGIGIDNVYTVVETSVPNGYSASYSTDSNGILVVTNINTPEKTSVPVQKVWVDANDQDGLRPDSVEVALYADGVATGKTLKLSASNNWHSAFNDLPKYANGNEIVYTVAEVNLPAAYTSSVEGGIITNTHIPATTKVHVQKVWNDADNQDGVRPTAVVVTLYVNGRATDKTMELNGDEWKGTWDNLPVNHNGQRISYSVVETAHYDDGHYHAGLPAGYIVTHDYDTNDAGEHLVTLTNTRATDKTQLNVQKVWNDDDNRAGKRPASITVQLLADGQPVGEPVELSPANEWDATFTNLDVNSNGKAIVYTVEEIGLDSALGYTADYKYDYTIGVATITNTRQADLIDVSVRKDWDDSNNRDGMRPESITVELFANGIATKETVTLDGVKDAAADGTYGYESEPWVATFTGLHKHYDGNEIVYSVEEVEVPGGYEVSYDTKNAIVNSHEAETISYPVSKEWVDGEDRDGIRPDEITVTLYADGISTGKTLKLNASNNWSDSFKELPKYKEGAVKVLIDYSVKEDAVEGYQASYNEGAITNTHTPAVTSVSVKKIWNDNENQDGKRPASVTVHLLANGEHLGENYKHTLDASGNWTYTWKNLPKYEEGKLINYTVYEEEVGDGYSASYSRDEDDTVVITNTRNLELTTFTVQKVWVDANNQDNLRYEGVMIQLYAGDTAHGEPVEVNAENHWRYTWTELPRNKNGVPVSYKVAELNYIDKNGAVVDLNENHYEEGEPVKDSHTGITTITNTHTTQKTDVAVKKEWVDNKNQDGIRPASVVVELHSNGMPTGKTATLSEANGWTHTFKNLDVHHGIGIDNVYTVEEIAVPDGYSVSYNTDSNGTLVITNTHTPDAVSVPVSKVWEDAGDQDGIRPDSIVVALYADGVATGTTITLDVTNNWHSSFENLPKYANGKAIVYTVAEVNVPEGYTSAVAGNVITNTHIPETTDLNVQKVWDDANNQDGKRPTAIAITLYANGHEMNTLTLNAENGWKGAWEDMPVYHNGQRISYTADETGYYVGETYYEGLPEGYAMTRVHGTNEDGEPLATLTNSYEPELISLNVQKVWEDDDNRAGVRPASITVKLLADGQPTGNTVVLNAENEWDATFLNLIKYNAGKEILYTVEEVSLDEALQYKVSYEYDYSIGVATIINTRQAEKIAVSAEKIWNDDNDRDGIRPDTVTVELYANGMATGETATLDGVKDAATTGAYGYESAPWTVEFANLYEYYMGSKITYSVVETNVAEGYEVSYKDNQIINTHTPATTSIPVEKLWEDGDNHDELRPETITVKLFADGENTGKSLTLSAADNWMGTFDNLLVYNQGKKIAYSVVENVIPGYNIEVVSGKPVALEVQAMNGKITITNRHKLETTQLTATKVWEDKNDQDGKRPESIILHLLANGYHMGEDYKRVLSEENGWTYTWKNLQKNYNGDPIAYTVFEEPVGNGYDVQYALDPENHGQITVINSYTPETTVVSAVKVWNDDGNRDGLRPASITVELYANEKATGKTLVLDEENKWYGQWQNLPKYFDHGTEVVYDVVEIGYTDSEGNFVTGLPYGPDSVTTSEDTEFAPGMFIVTNTHLPATTGVNVSKIWDDFDNNDGKRPDGILVQLYANSEPVENAVAQLNEANRWSHTWTKIGEESLYVYMNGEPIVYTVDEVGYVVDGVAYEGLPEGYTKDITAEGYQLSITNTHALEKLNVAAAKIWNDGDDNDGLRPESLDVTLYCNGEAIAKVALNEANGWTYTWKNLNQYISGEEAVYSVQEAAVEGYTSAVTNSGNAWVFVNTHEVATKDLTISKVWTDANDAEGLRPDSIKAQLYKNGEAYGNVLTLTKKVDWKVTVPALPVYENGEKITWTVAEVDIPKYYSASYNQETLTITNTIQSKDIPKTGDNSNLMLWSGVMFVGAAGMFVLLMDERKRRHSS